MGSTSSEHLGLGKEVLQNGSVSHCAPLSWGLALAVCPSFGWAELPVPCQWLLTVPDWEEVTPALCFLSILEWSRKRPWSLS